MSASKRNSRPSDTRRPAPPPLRRATALCLTRWAAAWVAWHDLGQACASALVAGVLLATGCTLDIDAPYEPPPETWDPALNTHPGGTAFQALLDRAVREGLPGVVLYIRTPQGVWNGASGYAKIETGARMVPTCRFFAESATKMYTAAVVLLLAEEGLVDLDAPLGRYLPASVTDRVANADRATVRQLLGHTSGIPDFSGSLAYDLDTTNDPLTRLSPDRLLGYLEGQSPIFGPGDGYFYSNANFLLLALLIDHATGANHADAFRQRLFEPLGLDATSYRGDPGYPRPAGLVNNYEDLAGDGRIMNVSDLAVHGAEDSYGYSGVIATSADFAAFVDALFQGRIVRPETLSEMLAHTECDCYGLGLAFDDTPHGVGIGHGGGGLGSRAQVRYFPDLDATLVLLMNAGESGKVNDRFDRLWDEVVDAALESLD